MFRSPTVSFARRYLPATTACRTPGASARWRINASAYWPATASLTRCPCAAGAPQAERICCSVFGPKPRSSCICPASPLDGDVETGDVEMIHQQLDPLRPQPGQFEQFGNARRQATTQLFEDFTAASLDDRHDLVREVLTDTGQARELHVLRHECRYFCAEFFHRARGVAVGAHAKRIFAVDLEEIGDFIEQRGDVGDVDE